MAAASVSRRCRARRSSSSRRRARSAAAAAPARSIRWSPASAPGDWNRFVAQLMHSRIVGLVLTYVRSKGGDGDRLIREFGLPKAADTDVEVVLALPVLHAFLEAAEREIDDPFLGVHIATAYRRGIFGVMEYACRSAPTLREALHRIVRFRALMNDIVVVSFEERDGIGVIEQRVAVNPICLGRHANEFFVVTLVDQARL